MTLFRSDYDVGENGLFYMDQHKESYYYNKVIETPFDNQDFNFGSLVTCTVPKRDSVIKNITLKTILGNLNPSVSTGYVYTGPLSEYSATSGSQSVISNTYFGFYCTQYLGLWATGNLGVTIENNRFVFSSNTITFPDEASATFWGFDNWYLGRVYTGTATLTLLQSGWVPGFKPPVKYEKYNDNVGDLIVKRADVLIGGQTIQGMTTNTLTNQQLLYIPLENQAALTVLVGRGDTSYSNQSQTYWTSLLTDQIPCSALRNQDIQIKMEVEKFENLTSANTLGGTLFPTAYTFIANLPVTSVIAEIYGDYLYIVSQVSGGTGGYVYEYNLVTGTLSDPISGFSGQVSKSCISGQKLYIITTAGTLGHFQLSSTGIAPYVFDCSVSEAGLSIRGITPYRNSIYIFTNLQFYVWDGSTVTPSSHVWTEYGFGSGSTVYGHGVLIIYDKLYIPIQNSLLVLSVDQLTSTIIGPQVVPFSDDPDERPNIFDGTYIYFPSKVVGPYLTFYRLKVSDITIESFVYTGTNVDESPPVCTMFDGRYIYYQSSYAGTGGRIYTMDTFGTLSYIEFTDSPKYPTYFNFDGRYIYLTSTHDGITDLTRLDPFTIVPSIKSSVIIDYSDLQNEPTSVQANLIEQDQVLSFVLKAGPDPNFIVPFALKNLVWELRFETSAPIKSITMRINDVLLFQEDALSLFVLRPFQNHIITPSVDIGIYSFKSPVNFSRIRYPLLELTLTEPLQTDTTFTMTAKTYNSITCSGGTGGLMFN
jgi:hypothetical protein